MKHARLPDNMRERIIRDMPIGDQGWTVPWAVWADHEGKLWINGRYTLSNNPGGTVEMLVRRSEDGIEVSGIRRMTPQRNPTYVGSTMDDMLPVATVLEDHVARVSKFRY